MDGQTGIFSSVSLFPFLDLFIFYSTPISIEPVRSFNIQIRQLQLQPNYQIRKQPDWHISLVEIEAQFTTLNTLLHFSNCRTFGTVCITLQGLRRSELVFTLPSFVCNTLIILICHDQATKPAGNEGKIGGSPSGTTKLPIICSS
jgi:hypothetical protein